MKRSVVILALVCFMMGCVHVPPGQIKKQTAPGQIQKNTGYNPASGKLK